MSCAVLRPAMRVASAAFMRRSCSFRLASVIAASRCAVSTYACGHSIRHVVERPFVVIKAAIQG
jgi:hypothetical protein